MILEMFLGNKFMELVWYFICSIYYIAWKWLFYWIDWFEI